MTNPIKETSTDKPPKPYPDFPLFPHATGRWAKKIRGKLHYFGPWENSDTALERYLNERDDLYAGRKPRARQEGLTIRDLANRFLTVKQQLLETGEIVQRTLRDYHATCSCIVDVFGTSRVVEDLDSEDFEKLRAKLAKTRGPVALGNEVQRVRVVFKYTAYARLLIEGHPSRPFSLQKLPPDSNNFDEDRAAIVRRTSRHRPVPRRCWPTEQDRGTRGQGE